MKAEIFVSAMDKMLLELGAEKQKAEREYILQTKGGPLWILVDQRVDLDYWLFSRFLEVEKARAAFPTLPINRWSGKCNQSKTNFGVSPQLAAQFFKRQLEGLSENTENRYKENRNGKEIRSKRF